MNSGAQPLPTRSHPVHRWGFLAVVTFAVLIALPAIRVTGRAANSHTAADIEAPARTGAGPGQVIVSGSLSGVINHRPWRMGAFGVIY